MKLALLGYGKMGRLIEKIATDRGHEISLKIASHNKEELANQSLKKVDIAIDFSTADTVLENIKACFEARIPIVIGTTGWQDQLVNVQKECEHNNHTLLHTSNFSIGANIFFFANKVLAKMMNRYPQYEVQVEEMHHIHKIDSPSGTAITIAEDIISQINRKKEWVNELIGNEVKSIHKPNQLLIESYRLDEVSGTHTVIYSSEIDDIEFKHTAHNRTGFALGAVLAAEWLQGKVGFFSLTDMFDLNL